MHYRSGRPFFDGLQSTIVALNMGDYFLFSVNEYSINLNQTKYNQAEQFWFSFGGLIEVTPAIISKDDCISCACPVCFAETKTTTLGNKIKTL